MRRWFWNVTRYARAARFWLLALAALAWLGLGEARAQTPPARVCVDDACNRQQAYDECQLNAGFNNTQYGNAYCTARVQSRSYECRRYSSATTTQTCSPHYLFYWRAEACPAGTVWSDESNKCGCPSGSTYRPDGTCKSCESMNSEPGFGNIEVARPFKERCLGGCQFRAKPNASTCMLIGGAAAGTQHCSGEWEFTGASCSVSGGDPPMLESPIPGEPGTPKPKQVCTPGGSGQTVCIKENGDHCYSASTGRQICWKPGQVGEKGDGPVVQVRKPGTEAPLPSMMQTDAGDALTSEGEPMTVTSVINGQLTVTTTTQNYRTEHGTDAKPSNEGQGSDGDDEEQRNGASGGADCDSKPVVSDPALEMVATQAWATRCAVEAGNAASVSGDVGDCKSPFSVQGENANAQKLRAMRAQICGAEGIVEGLAEGLESGKGDAQSTADSLMPGEGESVFAQGDGGERLSSTRFGGGGGSCPAIGTFVIPGVGEIDTGPLCNALAALRFLFLALATIAALRIIGSE